jgi:hypothetical protein
VQRVWLLPPETASRIGGFTFRACPCKHTSVVKVDRCDGVVDRRVIGGLWKAGKRISNVVCTALVFPREIEVCQLLLPSSLAGTQRGFAGGEKCVRIVVSP